MCRLFFAGPGHTRAAGPQLQAGTCSNTLHNLPHLYVHACTQDLDTLEQESGRTTAELQATLECVNKDKASLEQVRLKIDMCGFRCR
jgi:hypothetical protein